MSDRVIQLTIYTTIAIISFVVGFIAMQFTSTKSPVFPSSSSSSSCNVALIKAQGGIYSYTYNTSADQSSTDSSSDGVVDAESVVQQIEDADANQEIRAIVLQIDSSGGTIVAGEEIANALKRAKKPTVSLIRGQGLSAAYWAATGADTIFASVNSEVGNIGVTTSYADNAEYNKSQGFTFHSLSSGKYKDLQNSNKPLTKDEETVVIREINELMNNFVTSVSENRHIPLSDITPDMRNAMIFTGSNALTQHLIDNIGDKVSVKDFLAQKLELDSANVTYCQ